MTVTITQIIFTLLTVTGVFLNRYNNKSDALEAAENKVYDIKQFIKFNSMNMISHLVSGILILFITNEIGLDYLVKSISGVDFTDIQERAVDVTVAVLSGLLGHSIINKFKTKKK